MASNLVDLINNVIARAKVIEGVQYADVFNDQIQRNEDGLTFDFLKPAILFEIDTPNQGVQTLGRYNQTILDLVFRLYIVYEQLDAGFGDMDRNLDVYYLRDAVKVAFTNYKPIELAGLWQYYQEYQDYAHNNIYVYRIEFKGTLIDTKGSKLDPDYTGFITKETPNIININPIRAWLPYKQYIRDINAVIYNKGIYIAKNDSNTDTFDIDDWEAIPSWRANVTYTVETKVAYNMHIYQCIALNADAQFIASNWVKLI